MTEKQRLAKLNQLETKLKRTTRGYTPAGVHWRSAMAILDELQDDAAAPVVPALGPIVAGGISILRQDCTHVTSGLGWPAFDDGWVAGKAVIAPEACVVDDDTSSAAGGGDAFYVKGASGLRYYVAHITKVPNKGTRFAKGKTMSRISPEHDRDHVHLAIDARPVIGHHLIAHTDYTHGAPTIGAQLAKAAT